MRAESSYFSNFILCAPTCAHARANFAKKKFKFSKNFKKSQNSALVAIPQNTSFCTDFLRFSGLQKINSLFFRFLKFVRPLPLRCLEAALVV